MISEEKKRFRDRANRNRLALLKEKEQHGYINDGSGKRYRAGVFFVLVGENRKALEFFSWFESEFPDDIGEPVFNLYWTLAEYRNGSEDQARYRLQHAMLSNLYMLPFLFGEPLGLLDIWHSSNRDQSDYLWEVEEYLNEPTEKERQWIKQEYNSAPFASLRNEYINTYRALKYERDFERRGALLRSWNQYAARFFSYR